MARRWAPPSWPALRAALGWTWAPFEVPDHLRAAWDGRERGARAAGRLGRRAWPPTAPSTRRWRPSSSAAWRGDLPADFDADVAQALDALAGQRRRGGHAQGLAAGAGRAGAGAARAVRRLGRPHRQQPDQLQGLHGGRPRPAGQPPELGRARIRHGRGAERHGAARRLHPLRRHLPDLQRLQPQRHPHGGADEAARDPCLHARQHRPGRRRAHAPERGACAVAAADPAAWTSGARPTRWRRRWPGPSRCAAATAPARWRCRARRVPVVAPPADRRRPIARGGYVLADAPRRARRDHRHRHRTAPGAAGAGAAGRRRRAGARGLDAQHDGLRPPGRGLHRRRAAAGSCRRWRWRPRTPTSGASTSAGSGAVVGIASFGESAPAPALYAALRHHGRARGRRGARRCSGANGA